MNGGNNIGLRLAADLEDLAPISNAIKLSLTVSEGDEWSPVFEKGTAIEANSEMLPNALAYQVFLERLIARLSGELEQHMSTQPPQPPQVPTAENRSPLVKCDSRIGEFL